MVDSHKWASLVHLNDLSRTRSTLARSRWRVPLHGGSREAIHRIRTFALKSWKKSSTLLVLMIPCLLMMKSWELWRGRCLMLLLQVLESCSRRHALVCLCILDFIIVSRLSLLVESSNSLYWITVFVQKRMMMLVIACHSAAWTLLLSCIGVSLCNMASEIVWGLVLTWMGINVGRRSRIIPKWKLSNVRVVLWWRTIWRHLLLVNFHVT